jgi:hypothetical protein
MWRSMLLLVLSCLFSLTSLAQKVEVFGGNQFTHLQPAFNASGWNVAVTGNFKHILGITGTSAALTRIVLTHIPTLWGQSLPRVCPWCNLLSMRSLGE